MLLLPFLELVPSVQNLLHERRIWHEMKWAIWGCNFDVFRFPQGPLLFDRSVSLRLTVVNAALCVYGRVCVMWPSSQHISQQLNASQHGIGDRGSSSWFFVNLFSISVYVNLNFSFRKRWSRSAMTRRSSQFFFSFFIFWYFASHFCRFQPSLAQLRGKQQISHIWDYFHAFSSDFHGIFSIFIKLEDFYRQDFAESMVFWWRWYSESRESSQRFL